jgi:hypothetical protein
MAANRPGGLAVILLQQAWEQKETGRGHADAAARSH